MVSSNRFSNRIYFKKLQFYLNTSMLSMGLIWLVRPIINTVPTGLSWEQYFVQNGTHLCDTKLVALTMTSSFVFTITGTLRQPDDLRILISSLRLSWRTFGGHMSIFVTTTKTGTESARARPRCSFVMPTIPALAPIWGQFYCLLDFVI